MRFEKNILLVNQTECRHLHKDLLQVEWTNDGKRIDEKAFKMSHWSDNLSYFAFNYYSDFSHKQSIKW